MKEIKEIDEKAKKVRNKKRKKSEFMISLSYFIIIVFLPSENSLNILVFWKKSFWWFIFFPKSVNKMNFWEFKIEEPEAEFT